MSGTRSACSRGSTRPSRTRITGASRHSLPSHATHDPPRTQSLERYKVVTPIVGSLLLCGASKLLIMRKCRGVRCWTTYGQLKHNEIIRAAGRRQPRTMQADEQKWLCGKDCSECAPCI